MSLYINGEISNQITPITSKDKIEYKIDEIEPVRSADVSITNNKMEAYINIKDNPIHIYELANQECHKIWTCKEKRGNKYPPKYTSKEIQELLINKGVRYGIIEEKLNSIGDEYEVVNKLISKGLQVIDDIPDEVKVLWKIR